MTYEPQAVGADPRWKYSAIAMTAYFTHNMSCNTIRTKTFDIHRRGVIKYAYSKYAGLNTAHFLFKQMAFQNALRVKNNGM